jgi:hypothetical protein
MTSDWITQLRSISSEATAGPWFQFRAGGDGRPLSMIGYTGEILLTYIEPELSDDGNEGINDARAIVTFMNLRDEFLAVVEVAEEAHRRWDRQATDGLGQRCNVCTCGLRECSERVALDALKAKTEEMDHG